ncbi:unnamed protein product [Phytomonas sp. EM1]|nr:unnamed protein product [Phytomonas sp. EM1]|eukprot:CCW60972.1 unnamed protein product [Phytomonas sp. isolate EM1]
MVELHVAEVEGHLAFCLQSYVGDHRRAARHYRQALAAIPKVAQLRELGLASCAVSGSARRRPHGGGKTTPPLLAETHVGVETLHWMLTNYVACCERLAEWKDAVAAQNQLLELEWVGGVDMSASYLRLIELVEKLGDIQKRFHLCFLLFFFLKEDVSAEFRVQVATSFAECCYLVGNASMGSILLDAVQEVKASNDPSVLIAYALNLRNLTEDERRRVEVVADLKVDVRAILRIFRRAAQLILTQRVIDADDVADPRPRDPAAAAALQRPTYRANFELMALIALSRGAFFFHQHGFTAEAEELYATAVAYAAGAEKRGGAEYAKELAILLANYAGLKAVADPLAAEQLYTRAAAVCPTSPEVAGVVADFFVMTGDYAKGGAMIRRFLALGSGVAAEMELRLARLGGGAAWEGLPRGEQLQLLHHLLRGLGGNPPPFPFPGGPHGGGL